METATGLFSPAIMLGVAAVAMGRWHLAGGEGKVAITVLASMTVMAAWAITLSILGIAARVRSVSMAVKYLSAASFWIYLVHHPILGIVHLDLKWLLPGANPILKTALASAVTIGACLLSYEVLIRRTRLGRWLGFAWRPVDGGNPTSDLAVGMLEAGPCQVPGEDIASPIRRAA